MATDIIRIRRGWAYVLLLLMVQGAASGQQYLGNFSGYTRSGSSLTLFADTASARFTFYRPYVVRLDFLPRSQSKPESSFVVIAETTESVSFSILETDSVLTVETSGMRIVCTKVPMRFSFYDNAGHLLLSEADPGGLSTAGTERRETFMLAADDHFYGTGERGLPLDRRGQAFDSYNVAIGGYTTPLSVMNVNVPFLASAKGYALYFDNTYQGRFDLGVTDATKFYYNASGGELTYYFIAAPTVQQQLKSYTWLTGRQPLPPRWAFGFIQSKYGYRTRSEAEDMVRMMRQERIPCDALILDLYWFHNMGDLAWNTSAFPDPFTMVDSFLQKGIKTILISEPYLTQYSTNYSEASSRGFLARTSSGTTYTLSNWWSCGCTAGLFDMTDSLARAWWWTKYESFMGNNVAGLWTDLGEPERHPLDMVHTLGSASRVHNIYDFLWAQTLFEGFGRLRPDRRIFNLTRSGFAGIQRYGAIPWSGDVGKAFGGLSVQIPMMLNMGMSGLAYHNSDIGGFCCGTTTPELYARWMQYGTFCPITRAHGVNQPTEPWGYGPETESISRKFIELRYQLLPYIYSMAIENYETGMPLARPLFFEDPTDLRLADESGSYFWGSEIIVSPVVVAGQTMKSLYLPKGTWIDFWTDQSYLGKSDIVVDAPLDRMPIFVRAGAIVPMQPLMQYSDERPIDTLFFHSYPSSGPTTTFSLYEDDGTSLGYQRGEFARMMIHQSVERASPMDSIAQQVTITIDPANGSYQGKLSFRTYISVIHLAANKPNVVKMNGVILPDRNSMEELRNGGAGAYYDSLNHLLFVQTPTSTDSGVEIVASGIALTTGVRDKQWETDFRLDQNYPNPFNSSTMIEYVLPERCEIDLAVYDPLGRRVQTLVHGSRESGKYSTRFDAAGLPTGVYFYRLQADRHMEVRKFLLVK